LQQVLNVETMMLLLSAGGAVTLEFDIARQLHSGKRASASQREITSTIHSINQYQYIEISLSIYTHIHTQRFQSVFNMAKNLEKHR